MLTVLWGAKGGSGTSVVSCALALLIARLEPVVLVDLAGDVPAVLGVAESPGPGIHDWVLSTTAGVEMLDGLTTAAADALRVIPSGPERAPFQHARWSHLGQHLAASATPVVVDGGTGPPPPGLVNAASRRLLVTRPCYLSLRHAVAASTVPTGVVVVLEPGRALGAVDVARAVQAPVVAEVTVDPAVARMIDAGLLSARLPKSMSASLRGLLR